MKCFVCNGAMEEQRANFCVCSVTPPIMVSDVPTLVCGQCGEEAYSDATVAILERIRDGLEPSFRLAYLRAYDFEELVEHARAVRSRDLTTAAAARSPMERGTVANPLALNQRTAGPGVVLSN